MDKTESRFSKRKQILLEELGSKLLCGASAIGLFKVFCFLSEEGYPSFLTLGTIVHAGQHVLHTKAGLLLSLKSSLICFLQTSLTNPYELFV